MSGTQLISVGFGKETFERVSASLAVFIVEAPFVRLFPSKKFTRQGLLQKFAASSSPEVNGWMFLDSVSGVPDGTVVMLQSSHRINASPVRDGALLIRARSTGAMLSVNANLPRAAESIHEHGFLAFQGCGDILSKADLKSSGLAIPRSFINAFMDEEEVSECFSVSVISPEAEPMPRYEEGVSRDGEKVFLKKQPKRKLTLRRI